MPTCTVNPKRVPKRSTAVPCPSIQTNKTFMRNRDDGFGNDEMGRKAEYRRLRAAGKSPGRFFSRQLMQWVDSKDDVKKICQQRNYGCEGLVNVKQSELEPAVDKPYEVADDIVEQVAEVEIAEQHGGHVTPKKRKRIKAELKTKLSGGKK